MSTSASEPRLDDTAEATAAEATTAEATTAEAVRTETVAAAHPVAAATATPARAPLGTNARAQRRRRIFARVVLAIGWIGLLLPLVSLFVFSIRFPLTGMVDFGGWTGLVNADGRRTTTVSLLLEGLGNSLIMAVITVVLMLVLLIPTMVWVRLKLPKLDRIIEFISLLPLTIPAIALVVGLAPIYAFISTRILDSNSIWLSFAYVVLVLPFSFRALDAGLRSINLVTLTEAARSFGASWFTVITRVVVPNIRPSIVSATFVSIAVVLGEYTIAAILARTNLQTVLYQINASDAQVAAAVSLLMLVLTSGLLVLLDVLTSRPRKESK